MRLNYQKDDLRGKSMALPSRSFTVKAKHYLMPTTGNRTGRDARLTAMPPSAAIAGSKSSIAASSGSILVIFPGALGDLICVIPTLRAIARRHPDAPLELMARAELARFATGRFGVVHAHSEDVARGSSRGHSIDRREVAQLFAARAGSIADEARTFFGPFAHVYSFFACDDAHFRGALEAITEGRASFLPFCPPGEGHVAAAYLREFSAANGRPADSESIAETSGEGSAAVLDCSYDLYPEELDLAEKRLASLGLKIHDFMLVLPGSGSSAKNWPAESFASLATLLAPQINPLVILGPAEYGLEPIFTASGIPAISQLELVEVAALARLSRCFIGNDSGVSHLAAAAGASGLALFGPTDPDRWRPLGHVTVIQREPLSTLTPAEAAAAMVGIIGRK